MGNYKEDEDHLLADEEIIREVTRFAFPAMDFYGRVQMSFIKYFIITSLSTDVNL